jgi:putative ABC transport system permease protein
MNDLRYGFRQLLRCKGTSLLALLILALGIGGTTAVFSVADKLLLNPIPGRDIERLFVVHEANVMSGFQWHVSPQLYQELASHTNLVESLTYFDQGSEQKKIQVAEKTVKLRGAKVAPNFFELLGIRPLAGRAFLPDDGAKETGNVIILSHELWQQHFGGAADVVGNTIKLDGTVYTVVGIMPPNGHVSFAPGNSQYWIPYHFPGEELARAWEPEGNPTWHVMGRLRKGAARQELQTLLDTVAARWLRDLYPPNQRWKFQVNPAREDFINPKVEKTLWSLQAMAGALLLVGCANVGNLLLSRAFSRRGEFGIRMAIGAGRWRIARQLFVESLSLAGLAAALGVFLAWGGIIGLEQFYLPQFGYLGLLGPSNVIGVDWRVLGITCLVAAAAGIFFGAAPALLAARVNVNESLKDARQQQSGGYLQRMFHDGLVVTQVSLAVVLLAGAGMMIRSVFKLLQVDPGLNPKGLYRVWYDVGSFLNLRYDLAAAMQTGLSRKEALAEAYRWDFSRQFNWQESILERFHAIPGIEVAAVYANPGGGYGFYPEGRNDLVDVGKAAINVRMGNYFRTVGVPLIAGRFLTKEDAVPGEQTIVINERLAEECWPGQNPLGKRLKPADDGHSTPTMLADRVVVGVVRNIEDWAKDADARPGFYEPYERLTYERTGGIFFTPGEYVFRTRLDSDALRKTLVRLGKEMSPPVELMDFYSIEAQLYRSTAPRRVMMWLLITLGCLGLVMSGLGVYAVMAYSVVRRTREIGIRMAMGAGRSQIHNLFVGHGARLIANGIGLGVVLAITAAHYIQSLLFGVSPADLWAFAGILLTLGVAAGIACWLPARRAARIDPMEALRYE